MKKLVSLLTIALVVGAFTGCGGGTDNSTSTPAKPDSRPAGDPASGGTPQAGAPKAPPPLPTAPAPPPATVE